MEITSKEMMVLKKKLKKLSKSWVTRIADDMKVNPMKVYNIISNRIVDNEWRIAFVASANKVIKELQDEQSKKVKG